MGVLGKVRDASRSEVGRGCCRLNLDVSWVGWIGLRVECPNVLTASVVGFCVKSCICSAWLSFLFGFPVFGFSVFVYGMSFCICMLCVATRRVRDLGGVGGMDGCVALGVGVLCRCVSSHSPTF